MLNKIIGVVALALAMVSCGPNKGELLLNYDRHDMLCQVVNDSNMGNFMYFPCPGSLKIWGKKPESKQLVYRIYELNGIDRIISLGNGTYLVYPKNSTGE